MEADDVLAVVGGADLADDVTTGVGHGQKHDGGRCENEADERGDAPAEPDEEHAEEQGHHHDAIRQIAPLGGHEVLNLRFKPMCGVHLGDCLGAVQFLLAARRGNANLGVKIIEVLLRNAHPVTFRIAAAPLPAVVKH